jgi:hypothetical protein
MVRGLTARTESARANISEKELRYYKKIAKYDLAMPEEQLKAALKAGKFIEI